MPPPGQVFTGQPYPGQPNPGQPNAGQPYPGQPYPGQPNPGQPYPGQQYPGQQFGNQPYAVQPGASGIQENVAGALCYVFFWVTGIIFLLIDKRPFVRFHAAQSIVVFGSLFLVRIVLAFVFGASYYYGGLLLLHSLIYGVLNLLMIGGWIVLMVLAYQGKRFEIPVVAGIAKSIAGTVQV
jgi:uncharacterized membrane protein